MADKIILEDRKVKDTFCCFGKHENINRCYNCIDEGFCEVETRWRKVENGESEPRIIV